MAHYGTIFLRRASWQRLLISWYVFLAKHPFETRLTLGAGADGVVHVPTPANY